MTIEKMFLTWAVSAMVVTMSCKPRTEAPSSEAAVSDEESGSCLKTNSIHYQSWDVAEQAWMDGMCFQLGMDLCAFGPKWILMEKNFRVGQRDGQCEFSYGRPDLLSDIGQRVGGEKPLRCNKLTLVKPDRAVCESAEGNKDLEL